MPDFDIQYVPVFGVEPFSNADNSPPGNFGGGAVNTQQNLVVTLWTTEQTGEGEDYVGKPDKLIRPFFSTPEGEAVAAAFAAELGVQTTAKTLGKTAFNSRTSSRFALSLNPESSYGYPLLAIMNCPPDLRNNILLDFKKQKDGSFLYTGGVFSQNAAWSISAREYVNGLEVAGSTGPTVECQILPPIPFIGAPFFKTDGSDGQPPEFLPFNVNISTSAFTGAAYEYMLNNPFYVGAYFIVEDSEAVVDIAWPYSAGRLS